MFPPLARAARRRDEGEIADAVRPTMLLAAAAVGRDGRIPGGKSS